MPVITNMEQTLKMGTWIQVLVSFIFMKIDGYPFARKLFSFLEQNYCLHFQKVGTFSLKISSVLKIAIFTF
jgi:hypothetical protein